VLEGDAIEPHGDGDAADKGGVELADQDHGSHSLSVMAGLDPAIHPPWKRFFRRVMDARVRPGHDKIALGCASHHPKQVG
jgi:hypothetical protein